MIWITIIYEFEKSSMNYQNHWRSDQYLCAGQIGQEFAPGIDAVSFIGPEIYEQNIKTAYWGGYIGPWDADCNPVDLEVENLNGLYKNLVMAGLDGNQGQLLMADGSASGISSAALQDRVKTHAETKGKHLVSLEVVSQPERKQKP